VVTPPTSDEYLLEIIITGVPIKTIMQKHKKLMAAGILGIFFPKMSRLLTLSVSCDAWIIVFSLYFSVLSNCDVSKRLSLSMRLCVNSFLSPVLQDLIFSQLLKLHLNLVK